MNAPLPLGHFDAALVTGAADGRTPRPATEAQIKFARRIRDATGVALPAEQTRQSLFLYIRNNILKFKCIQETWRSDPGDGEWPEDLRDATDEAVHWGLDPYTGGFDD